MVNGIKELLKIVESITATKVEEVRPEDTSLAQDIMRAMKDVTNALRQMGNSVANAATEAMLVNAKAIVNAVNQLLRIHVTVRRYNMMRFFALLILFDRCDKKPRKRNVFSVFLSQRSNKISHCLRFSSPSRIDSLSLTFLQVIEQKMELDLYWKLKTATLQYINSGRVVVQNRDEVSRQHYVEAQQQMADALNSFILAVYLS